MGLPCSPAVQASCRSGSVARGTAATVSTATVSGLLVLQCTVLRSTWGALQSAEGLARAHRLH